MHELNPIETGSNAVGVVINGFEHYGNSMGTSSSVDFVMLTHPGYSGGDITFSVCFTLIGAISPDTHVFNYGARIDPLPVVPPAVAVQGNFNFLAAAANRLYTSGNITVTPAETLSPDALLRVQITRTDDESNEPILLQGRFWYAL